MKKPVIGIVGVADVCSDDDKVICMWEDTRRAIVQKGGISLLIMPTQDIEYETVKPRNAPLLTEVEKEDLNQVMDLCDGILLSGGYFWYEYNSYICEYAFEKNIPLLGICMGMQILGTTDSKRTHGIEITNAFNETELDHHQREVKYVHDVTIMEGTLLSNIIGKDKIKVNSKHRYHLDHVHEFVVSAYAEDGLIEAIEVPGKKFIMGVQWHPETMLSYDESANAIIDAFIKSASLTKK